MYDDNDYTDNCEEGFWDDSPEQAVRAEVEGNITLPDGTSVHPDSPLAQAYANGEYVWINGEICAM